MNFENIKVVIPARYASTRLPGKPLLLIDQKPMFWHVVQRCIEAGFKLADIQLATDDMRIFDVAQKHHIPVTMTSSEHESGSDRINEVAQKNNWGDDTIVLNVQGDEPLISKQLIKDLASFALANPHFSITTAAKAISCLDEFINPNVVKAILGQNSQALYFTRSPAPLNRDDNKDLSYAFKHVGVYAYTVASLRSFCSFSEAPLEQYEKLEQLRALSYGMNIGVFVFDGMLKHGVDTSEDYEQIKELMENNNESN